MGQYYSEFTVDGVKKDIYDKYAVHLDDFAEVFEAQLLQSAIKTAVLDLYFPIGTAIIRRDNPGDTIGGEWEQLKDVVIVGAGGKFSYGQTGGYSEPALPRHAHEAYGSTTYVGDHTHDVRGTTDPAGGHEHAMRNMFSGGSGGGLARYKTTSDRTGTTKYTEFVPHHTHIIALRSGQEGGHKHGLEVEVDYSGDSNITDKNYPPFKALNIWIRTA